MTPGFGPSRKSADCSNAIQVARLRWPGAPGLELGRSEPADASEFSTLVEQCGDLVKLVSGTQLPGVKFFPSCDAGQVALPSGLPVLSLESSVTAVPVSRAFLSDMRSFAGTTWHFRNTRPTIFWPPFPCSLVGRSVTLVSSEGCA